MELFEQINRMKTLSGDRLTEVDWENSFKDVKKNCIRPEDVVEMLNSRLDRLNKPANKRGRVNANEPIVSRNNIPQINDDIDINAFINEITSPPKQIFDRNPKMEKTDKERFQYTINTGIPALRGILYDEENKKFFIVNTCPGAGSCAVVCYARRGFYIMNDVKNLKYIQRLNLLLNNPEEYENMIMDELEIIALTLKQKSRKVGKNIQLIIRWNDAGDFFAQRYFDIALSATNQLLKSGYNVVSYAYTKMGDIANITNPNFVMNFSDDANKKETEKVDKSTKKLAKIVPKALFDDIFLKDKKNYVLGDDNKPMFKNSDSAQKLKQILSKEYNLPIESLIYTDELPFNDGGSYKYNLIVKPTNDSDIGAQRRDVRYSLLLHH